MAIFKKYPVSELVRLGPEINEVVGNFASENIALLALAGEMENLAGELMEIRQPESMNLEMADRVRDALVISFVHGLSHFSYRLDRKDLKEKADRLEAKLLDDGYAWIKAPYGEESARIHRLLNDASDPQIRSELESLNLNETIEAIAAAQLDFEKAEFTASHLSEQARDALQQIRNLIKEFHQKIELYTVMVQNEYSDGEHLSILAKLIKPLYEATSRIKARGEV